MTSLGVKIGIYISWLDSEPDKFEVVGSSPTMPTIKVKIWEFSSAGSEHLPYKQRVGGSNPSTPTINGIRRSFVY